MSVEAPVRAATAPGLAGWSRVHPLSPLLGGWAVLTALGSVALQNRTSPDTFSRVPLGRLGFLIAAAVLVGLIAIGMSYLAWAFHSFRVTDEAIEQRKGMLFRQTKQARIDRIQAVDVVQPLIARFLGLATVKVEVAGGQGSAIVLQHLKKAQAEAFRVELMARASGAPRPAPAAGDDAVDDGGLSWATPQPPAAAEAEPLVTVPTSRAVTSVLLSGSTIVGGVLVIGFIATAIVLRQVRPDLDLVALIFGGGAIGVALGAIGWFSQAVNALNHSLRFRLGVDLDGVRIAHGMLETTRQTIPPGRVQALKFTQTLLWRRPDWWRASVNVAGYHAESLRGTTLLPVGTVADAARALRAVAPHVADGLGEESIATTLGAGPVPDGMLMPPRQARWLDPFGAKRSGVRATEEALILRGGVLQRHVIVVPHERVQGLRITQGPWQRALGLASVTVRSTVGPVSPVVTHLAVADAIALVKDEAIRARQGRAVATPEQWLAAVKGEA